MNVLITGIGGLLGSRLAHWLLAHTDSKIYGIDDYSCGYPENVPDDPHRVFVYEYSLGTERPFPRNLFASIKPDIVFHLAAYAAEGLSPWIRQYNYRNNLLATAEVVNACIDHRPQRLARRYAVGTSIFIALTVSRILKGLFRPGRR